MPPAAARVVPRAEMTTDGLIWAMEAAHLVVSPSTWAVRDSDVGFGARREMVWTGVKVEVGERRLVRIWEPVRPVEPKSATEVMLAQSCVDLLMSVQELKM